MEARGIGGLLSMIFFFSLDVLPTAPSPLFHIGSRHENVTVFQDPISPGKMGKKLVKPHTKCCHDVFETSTDPAAGSGAADMGAGKEEEMGGAKLAPSRNRTAKRSSLTSHGTTNLKDAEKGK